MARRTINVAQFRGEPTNLKFATGVFPVRGDLPLDVMLYMQKIEDDAREASDNSDVMEWMVEGRALLTDLVRELTPDAELPMLSADEILGTLAVLVYGDSVSEALADAMTAGMDAATVAAAAEADPTTAVEPPKAKKKRASRSAKPSSDSSSDSASRTNGRRAGGTKRAGPSSKPSATSTTSSSAA